MGPSAYTPHDLRFNKRKFKDKSIPYGAEVDYLPTSATEVELQQKAGPRMLKGIFVGYKLNPGGAWGGEYLVFDKQAFLATRQGMWVKEHTTREIYMPGESADDAGQLTFPVREGRWKQLPGNQGLKRFFKPKRKPAETEMPPQREGDDADDEALEDADIEPMWGDETLARLDGEEGELADQEAEQGPLSGSDDPAVEEPGGNEPPVLKDYWEERGLFIYRVHVVPRTMRFAPTPVRRGTTDTTCEYRSVPYDNPRQVLPNTTGRRHMDRT